MCDCWKNTILLMMKVMMNFYKKATWVISKVLATDYSVLACCFLASLFEVLLLV